MPGIRQFSSGDFLQWVREYLPADPAVYESDSSGRRGPETLLPRWRPNRFYYFDSDTVSGICHALEVLALEEANGSMISLLGDFKEFDLHRECYCLLAATIGRVECLGFGRTPRNLRHLQFRRDERARQFRGVLYQGETQQAMFLCRWEGPAQGVGFFSLDGGLIEQFGHEFSARRRPRLAQPREWSRLQALDQAAKALEADWARQRQWLDAAVRRLQTDRRYQPGHFASELEKGLSRLSEWKLKMPRLLARADR